MQLYIHMLSYELEVVLTLHKDSQFCGASLVLVSSHERFNPAHKETKGIMSVNSRILMVEFDIMEIIPMLKIARRCPSFPS